jgi:hypothetical protein
MKPTPIYPIEQNSNSNSLLVIIIHTPVLCTQGHSAPREGVSRSLRVGRGWGLHPGAMDPFVVIFKYFLQGKGEI